MRPMIRVVTALAFAFVSTLPSARAADADTEFDAFLARWRAAVAANDVDAVVAMTRLPFLFEGRDHAREGVAREVVPALLTVEVRHCLRTAAPLREDYRYVLACAPYQFHLGRVDGEWRWVEFAADGEG